MSDILHDTLHVWHIDLSYSYKQKTTNTPCKTQCKKPLDFAWLSHIFIYFRAY